MVLSWFIYRLEASIAIDTDEKRATAKSMSTILDPFELRLNVNDLV